ncbi:hypothetical protein [Candidatus Protochlamydia amoebophila]|uniref:Uncharacterized protein n=1 Tax=Candidatus Protochlamydia amoebophila TaxID=362787 RepID=A0A0C1HDP5_9BACT|nr:hypothetical protein [Candidatus Protochlamydia amoebophila]KIC72883.1 hypothetical protein DB44_BY00060 [Candidatus Protochlamydia amoebophila]
MIKNVLSRWNPLNIFGTEVEYQDLLHQPLESDETLMQDSRGCIHRLKVSSTHSTFGRQFFIGFKFTLIKKVIWMQLINYYLLLILKPFNVLF